MQEAAKGFRRLKAHKQLPALRAVLGAHQTKNSTRGVLARQANAANIDFRSDRLRNVQQSPGHSALLMQPSGFLVKAPSRVAEFEPGDANGDIEASLPLEAKRLQSE